MHKQLTYNVGDHVFMVSKPRNPNNGPGWASEMDELIGRPLKIMHLDELGRLKVQRRNSGYWTLLPGWVIKVCVV